MKMIIPAYIYPGAPPRTEWSNWIAHSQEVSHIIANPGSPGGPGTSTDTNYAAVIAAAQQAGIVILGYVDTNFTGIATGVVTGQIDDWFTFYGIRDIFFDNVSSGAVDLAYYSTVSTYAYSHGATRVMFNHGTDADVGYRALSDIQCTFEGPKSTYDTWMPAQTWELNTPPGRICHLVYACGSNADVTKVFSQARQQNVSFMRGYSDTGAWLVQNAFLAQEYTEICHTQERRQVAGWGVAS